MFYSKAWWEENPGKKPSPVVMVHKAVWLPSRQHDGMYAHLNSVLATLMFPWITTMHSRASVLRNIT